MYNRLLTFLKKHRILTDIQHGFIENKSTETASQSFIESVQEALANQRKAIGIFLDLSKAYVINHETLLDKLDLYGVRGTINNWFKSYLSRRTQVVEISYPNEKESIQEKLQSLPKKIEHGVPQGSILGPLLFLLYTGCPRRKGPNFGRVFLRSNYTDITQNTYIQSSMVTEILAREKCGFLLCLHTVLCP